MERAGDHLVDALTRLFTRPVRVQVSGLNPHAGEGGLFGEEDAHVVAPAVAALAGRHTAAKADISGPVPAEAVFRAAKDGRVDGVVAMYHDQATIASKLLDWGDAVNVTWGLPFVRTSVDHGVAYDAVRANTASHDGMRAALAMARALTEGDADGPARDDSEGTEREGQVDRDGSDGWRMSGGRIEVKGARTHNLANVDLTIAHDAITVVTGPSGSGKSSLAFATVFAEGQRRYVEGLSAQARRFLARLPKPDVDWIDGLRPALAVEQRAPARNSALDGRDAHRHR